MTTLARRIAPGQGAEKDTPGQGAEGDTPGQGAGSGAAVVGAAAAAVVGVGGARLDRAALRAPAPVDAGADDRVALWLHDPLALVAALVALDGRAGAVLLLSHALDPATVDALAQAAECTAIVTDRPDDAPEGLRRIGIAPPAKPPAKTPATPPAETAPAGPEDGTGPEADPVATRWLMTTSGTTGLPKIVPHDLASLSRSTVRFTPRPGSGLPADGPVWGLLYDPTRFAGMQVVLQALLGGGRLVAVDTDRPLADQVAQLAAEGCTHLSATPTLWRRMLMVPGRDALSLRQVTLGGEIADQPTLNALRAAFPDARLTHIYASTEAGVGFSVIDGRAGFPAAFLDAAPGGVRMRIRDDILWLRPPSSALTPGLRGIEVDAEGFVRSGDMVRVEDDRVVFLGRENGLINIGGVKVPPERVEAVIKDIEGVAQVLVSAKRSPVTGALVVAEVELAPGADKAGTKARILEACRARLEREAVPAILRFVDGFQTNAAGKLVRTKGTAQ